MLCMDQTKMKLGNYKLHNSTLNKWPEIYDELKSFCRPKLCLSWRMVFAGNMKGYQDPVGVESSIASEDFVFLCAAL